MIELTGIVALLHLTLKKKKKNIFCSNVHNLLASLAERSAAKMLTLFKDMDMAEDIKKRCVNMCNHFHRSVKKLSDRSHSVFNLLFISLFHVFLKMIFMK